MTGMIYWLQIPGSVVAASAVLWRCSARDVPGAVLVVVAAALLFFVWLGAVNLALA